MNRFLALGLLLTLALAFAVMFGCGEKSDYREEPDREPPTAPIGLAVQKLEDAYGILLTWVPNIEEDVAGYNVYRSIADGTGYERISEQLIPAAHNTVFRDYAVLLGGKMYSYVVTAVDDSRNESTYSEEVEIKAPYIIIDDISEARSEWRKLRDADIRVFMVRVFNKGKSPFDVYIEGSFLFALRSLEGKSAVNVPIGRYKLEAKAGNRVVDETFDVDKNIDWTLGFPLEA